MNAHLPVTLEPAPPDWPIGSERSGMQPKPKQDPRKSPSEKSKRRDAGAPIEAADVSQGKSRDVSWNLEGLDGEAFAVARELDPGGADHTRWP